MKIKKMLALVLVICCTAAVSFSQKQHRGKGTIEDRINTKLDKMDQVVKFTSTQRNDLKVLFTDLAKRKKDAFCTNEKGTNGMKNTLKAIKHDKKEGMKKVLTPEQMKLWKAHQKEQKGSHKGKGNHHKKGKKGDMEGFMDNRLNKMDEVVKFTGSQRNDLKALFTDVAKRKKDALCANEMGTDGMKNAMKAIHEEQKEGIKKILTEDQLKIWKDYKKTQEDKRKTDHPKDKNKLEK